MSTKPKLVKLSFASLDRLANGAVGDAVDTAISQALNDIAKYGHDGKPRKIDLEVSIKSKPLKGVIIFSASVNVKCILPSVKPGQTHGVIEVTNGNAEAMFNTVSAANPDQLVMFDEETK